MSEGWSDHELAPEPGTVLCPLEDVPDGDGTELVFGETTSAFRMFVIRRGESVWGYVNACPHVRLTINLFPNRFVSPDGERILCANHGALFEIATGYCVAGPCAGESLTRVPVGLRDGNVIVTASR